MLTARLSALEGPHDKAGALGCSRTFIALTGLAQF
jgi:hypothetical protein